MTEKTKPTESTNQRSSPRSSPRPSSILNNKKEMTYADVISFLNENIMKIFIETISIIILILFLIYFLKLRKAKKEEIQKLKNSDDPKQSKCQKNYEENRCDDLHNNDNPPPLLINLCNEFDRCRHEKSKIPTASELTMSHIGSLLEAFVSELSTKTVFSILIILSINILVDTLRNRPKIVI